MILWMMGAIIFVILALAFEVVTTTSRVDVSEAARHLV
jgi:hypothetical protein